MVKAAVLLSAYNGERFLKEQINSILAQEDIDLTLFVRDDGSSDRTAAYLQEYEARCPNLRLLRGENVGLARSFMSLVYQAGDAFDYYAFSDQDDVWLPGKMRRAVELLQRDDAPLLYASNQTLADPEKKPMGLRYEEDPSVSIKQILCANKIAGCTMVWGRPLQRQLLKESARPSDSLLQKRIHDVWVGSVAASLGHICYDPQSFILYRIHENNVVGVRRDSLLDIWKKKLRNPALRNGRSLLAQSLLRGYKEQILDPEKAEFLRACAFYRTSLSSRLSLLKRRDIPACTGESRLSFAAKVLLGLF